MRIAVLGATGGIGMLVVKQALARGHEVTAVVRDPSRLHIRAEQLSVVVAEIFDPVAFRRLVDGRDAVLSAMGPRPGGPADVCSRAAGAVISAGVRRVVVVSASGPYVDGGDDPLTRFVVKPVVQRILRESFADLEKAEQVIRGSGLDWTLVRPSRLTDKPASGRERRSLDRNLPFGLFTPRAAVAGEMLRALDDPGTIGHAVAVAK